MPDALDPVRDDPDYKAWAARQADGMVSQLQSSTVAITLVPADLDVDIDYAVQLGMMILLDKPIVIVAPPGRQIPPKLEKIADAIIVGEINSEAFDEQLYAVLDKLGIQ